MKLWLCASAALLAAALPGSSGPQAESNQGKAAQPRRVNESTLSGLRPGRDSLEKAEKQFRGHAGLRRLSEEGFVEWQDHCLRVGVRMELNAEHRIEAITVLSYPTLQAMIRGNTIGSVWPNCPPDEVSAKSPVHPSRLKTGRGLALGDPRARVLQLYGEPSTRGPSTFAGRELELFFYEFDWAGVDVPQLMEVSCDRETGRVVKITLAFPTL